MANWGIPLPGRADAVTRRTRRSARAALGTHAGDGRLTREELGERVALVDAAERNDEIDAVFADLPQPHPRFSVAAQTGFFGLGCVGLIVLVCTLAYWGATGNWVPLAIATAVCFGSWALDDVIGRRRISRLRNSQDERQRRQLRASQYDVGGVRLGNTERVAAAETLIVHAAAGLPLDEYHAYVDQLPTIRTRSELTALIGHLPPPDPRLADTVLSPADDEKPFGIAGTIAVLSVVPGLPVAILMWARYGQYPWLLLWAGVALVYYLWWTSRRRRRLRGKADRPIPGMVG